MLLFPGYSKKNKTEERTKGGEKEGERKGGGELNGNILIIKKWFYRHIPPDKGCCYTRCRSKVPVPFGSER